MTRDEWATKILHAYGNDHSEACTHERIAIVVDEIVESESNAHRMENHRLTELVKAANLVHIRLRDGLRRALEAIDAHDQHRGVCDDNVMADGELAELRKLVTP